MYGALTNSTAGLQKNGSGKLELFGDTDGGSNVLNSGILALGADNVLSTNLVLMNGGTLSSADSSTRTLTNVIYMNADSVFGDAIKRATWFSATR